MLLESRLRQDAGELAELRQVLGGTGSWAPGGVLVRTEAAVKIAAVQEGMKQWRSKGYKQCVRVGPAGLPHSSDLVIGDSSV